MELPTTRGSRTGLITIEIVIERQTCTALGRTCSTDRRIEHRDSRAVSIVAYTLGIYIIVGRSFQAGDQDTVRMINDSVK